MKTKRHSATLLATQKTEVVNVKIGIQIQLVVVSLALSACGGDVVYEDICEPGAVCICPGGERGTQVCEEAGENQCACGGDMGTRDADAGTGDIAADGLSDPENDVVQDPGADPTLDTPEELADIPEEDVADVADAPEDRVVDSVDAPDLPADSFSLRFLNAATGLSTTLPCVRIGDEWHGYPELEYGGLSDTRRWQTQSTTDIRFVLDSEGMGDCNTTTAPVVDKTISTATDDQILVAIAGIWGDGDLGNLEAIALSNQYPTPESGSDYAVRPVNFLSEKVSVSSVDIFVEFPRVSGGAIPDFGVHLGDDFQIRRGAPFQLMLHLGAVELSFSVAGVAPNEGCLAIALGSVDAPRDGARPSLLLVCETSPEERVLLDPQIYILNVIDDLRDDVGREVSLTIQEPDGDSSGRNYGTMTGSLWVSSSAPISVRAGARELPEVDINALPLDNDEQTLVIVAGTNDSIEALPAPAALLASDTYPAIVLINARSNKGQIYYELETGNHDIAGNGHRDFFQVTAPKTTDSGFDELVVQPDSESQVRFFWDFPAELPDRQFVVVAGNPVAERGKGAFELFSVTVPDDESWQLQRLEPVAGTLWVRLANAMIDEGPIRFSLNGGYSESVESHAAGPWTIAAWDGLDLKFAPLWDASETMISATEQLFPDGAEVSPGDLITLVALGSQNGTVSAAPTLVQLVAADPDPKTEISLTVGVNASSPSRLRLFDDNHTTTYGTTDDPFLYTFGELSELPDPLRMSVSWPAVGTLPEASFSFPQAMIAADRFIGKQIQLILFGRVDIPEGEDGWPRLMILNEHEMLDLAEADAEVFFLHAVPDLVANDSGSDDTLSLDISWEGGAIGSLGPVGFSALSPDSLAVRPNLPGIEGQLIEGDAVLTTTAIPFDPQVANFIVAAGFARDAVGSDTVRLIHVADDLPRAFGQQARVVNVSPNNNLEDVTWWADPGTGWVAHMQNIVFGGWADGTVNPAWSEFGFAPSSDTSPLVTMPLPTSQPPHYIFTIGQTSCLDEPDVHPFSAVVVWPSEGFSTAFSACDGGG